MAGKKMSLRDALTLRKRANAKVKEKAALVKAAADYIEARTSGDTHLTKQASVNLAAVITKRTLQKQALMGLVRKGLTAAGKGIGSLGTRIGAKAPRTAKALIGVGGAAERAAVPGAAKRLSKSVAEGAKGVARKAKTSGKRMMRRHGGKALAGAGAAGAAAGAAARGGEEEKSEKKSHVRALAKLLKS